MAKQLQKEDKIEEEISGRDFVESNKDIIYKERVIFLLDKKYPSQFNSFSKWIEILKKEDI